MNMDEKIKMISRRKMLSLLGLGTLALSAPSVVMMAEAEAETSPAFPQIQMPWDQPKSAPEERRNTRSKRRQGRRNTRSNRRQDRHNTRSKRRQARRSPNTAAPK
jgi:hypothetical protein